MPPDTMFSHNTLSYFIILWAVEKVYTAALNDFILVHDKRLLRPNVGMELRSAAVKFCTESPFSPHVTNKVRWERSQVLRWQFGRWSSRTVTWTNGVVKTSLKKKWLSLIVSYQDQFLHLSRTNLRLCKLHPLTLPTDLYANLTVHDDK